MSNFSRKYEWLAGTKKKFVLIGNSILFSDWWAEIAEIKNI